MKTRVLWSGESVLLNTGYSVYGREVLQRLHATGKYEIAEIACFLSEDDKRMFSIPWLVYPTVPSKNDKARYDNYMANPQSQFGVTIFNEACLHFKPHVVIDIRDYWMFSHEETSPLRPYYKWAIMPTVDAEPQHEQWLSTFSNADYVFTYQDWSARLLKRQNQKINILGSAPPCADNAFYPINKNDRESIKQKFGIKHKYVLGTVMRNQPRKLYPNLFHAFRLFLDRTGRTDVALHCHTSYPDMGWDIPKYLIEFGLTNNVYFTYLCNACKNVFANKFHDALIPCPECNNVAAGLVNANNGVPNDVLAKIYNCFDLYVQYSNSEGFGMPQVEAAACGVPICATNYSAMQDVLDKLNGFPIRVLTLQYERDTGCKRAIPDDSHAADVFAQFFSFTDETREAEREIVREAYEKYYNWDTTANKWMSVIDSVDNSVIEKNWHSPAKLHTPPNYVDNNLSTYDYSVWLIKDVLGEPNRLHSNMHTRLIRDLTYGITDGGFNGSYYNELSASWYRPTHTKFDRETAYNHMVHLCLERNHWEKRRANG